MRDMNLRPVVALVSLSRRLPLVPRYRGLHATRRLATPEHQQTPPQSPPRADATNGAQIRRPEPTGRAKSLLEGARNNPELFVSEISLSHAVSSTLHGLEALDSM